MHPKERLNMVEIKSTLDLVMEKTRNMNLPRSCVAKMKPLQETARGHLLARRLNELDQALYRIEDLFEDLEGAL